MAQGFKQERDSRSKRILLSVWTAAVLSGPLTTLAIAADRTSLEATEAMFENNQATHIRAGTSGANAAGSGSNSAGMVAGSSVSTSVSGSDSFFHRVSMSNFTVFGGPPITNMAAHPTTETFPAAAAATPTRVVHTGHHGRSAPLAPATPGAPIIVTHQQPYSMRDNLEATYRINDQVRVGPMATFSYRFSDNNSIRLGDPSVRASVDHIMGAKNDSTAFDAGLWFTYTAPVSEMSRATGSYGTTSASYMPRLTFNGSRFFMSGLAGMSCTVAKEQGGENLLSPFHLNTSVSGSYRFSRKWTAFVSNSESFTVGPLLPIDGDALTDPTMMDNNAKLNRTTNVSVAMGAFFRPTSTLTLSPRLSWDVSEPISTTTLSLSAGFPIL